VILLIFKNRWCSRSQAAALFLHLKLKNKMADNNEKISYGFADNFGFTSPFGENSLFSEQSRNKDAAQHALREQQKVIKLEAEKKMQEKRENKYPPNSKGTSLLLFLHRIEKDVPHPEYGTVKKEVYLAQYDYTFEFNEDTNKGEGYLWKGEQLKTDIEKENAVITSIKNIFDSLLKKSKLMRKIHQEMLDTVDTKWKNEQMLNDKKVWVKDLRGYPIKVYTVQSDRRPPVETIAYCGYYSPDNPDVAARDNRIQIGDTAAPILLFNKQRDPTPKIENDVFHEFSHAYDSYLEKTLKDTDIEIAISQETAIITDENRHHLGKKIIFKKREEFAVHMENKYRKEQKMPLRLSYPFDMKLDLWGDSDFIDILLLEDGHFRKYSDNYDYDKQE
jgi:hypothetical protein